MAKKDKKEEEAELKLEPEPEVKSEPKLEGKVVYTSRGPMLRMPDGSLEPTD